MSANLVESLIGAVVLLFAAWFLFFVQDHTGGETGASYSLLARFDRVDGLGVGADVRLSGIKIGSIVETHLDPDTYQAMVKFSVAEKIQLPSDTAAAITSEGLLGGAYLSLLPGGDIEFLAPGDEIAETQDAVDLVGLIGKFIYGDKGSDSEPQASKLDKKQADNQD